MLEFVANSFMYSIKMLVMKSFVKSKNNSHTQLFISQVSGDISPPMQMDQAYLAGAKICMVKYPSIRTL